MIIKYTKYFFFLTFMLFFLTKAHASNEYFKCPEKISNILKGEHSLIKIGSVLGNNYINFHKSSPTKKNITIKFKYLNSNKKAILIINNKKLTVNSLGYEINERFSDSEVRVDNTYRFIKLDETYAFSRKENYWSAKKDNYDQKNYEYESSGRCIKIDKKEFDAEGVVKVVKKINKKSNKIKGERNFALSWVGIDELIIGKLLFDEEDLIGKLYFDLPEGGGSCIGTYVLSTSKGTWSILCEKKNLNASGLLKWDSKNGTVSGTGKDSKGKKVKFKVAGNN